MWLELSQIKKQFTEGNARKLAFIWSRLRHKNQKNTRGVTLGYSFRRALM